MDCTLDQDLIDEGVAREMVNRIQKTRKDLNFNVSDRIEIVVHTTIELSRVFDKFQSYISAETLMEKGSVSKIRLDGAIKHEIDESIFEVVLKKI
jgi:isoleucyl-tRNA synthetase